MSTSEDAETGLTLVEDWADMFYHSFIRIWITSFLGLGGLAGYSLCRISITKALILSDKLSFSSKHQQDHAGNV
jgi:hypothetical protein